MKRYLVLTSLLLSLPAVAWAAGPGRPGSIEPGMLPPPNVLPKELEEVGIEEHLGTSLPLDLPLVDHEGRAVRLGDYFRSGRPVVLNLGYYGCPMLCGLVTQGLLEGVKKLKYTPGVEFDVVTVTIDPAETTKLAAEKRASVLEALGKPGAEKGWSFHTASAEAIAQLTSVAGFRYRWDERGKQWSHAAAILVISPEGTIARYLYGLEYPPSELKLALLDASQGRIGSAVDKLLLFCFHYDPVNREYVLFAQNLMKVGGVVTVLALGSFLVVLFRRNRPKDVLHDRS